jgi:hypothetical protein
MSFQTSKSPTQKEANDAIDEKVLRSLTDDALEDEDAVRALFALGDDAVPPLKVWCSPAIPE